MHGCNHIPQPLNNNENGPYDAFNRHVMYNQNETTKLRVKRQTNTNDGQQQQQQKETPANSRDRWLLDYLTGQNQQQVDDANDDDLVVSSSELAEDETNKIQADDYGRPKQKINSQQNINKNNNNQQQQQQQQCLCPPGKQRISTQTSLPLPEFFHRSRSVQIPIHCIGQVGQFAAQPLAL